MYKIKWEIEVDDYELDELGYQNNKLGAAQYIWNNHFNVNESSASVFKVNGKEVDVKAKFGKVEE
jgi:hypothetical protein